MLFKNCIITFLCYFLGQLFTGNSLSLLTLPNIKPDRNVSKIEEGNLSKCIFKLGMIRPVVHKTFIVLNYAFLNQ